MDHLSQELEVEEVEDFLLLVVQEDQVEVALEELDLMVQVDQKMELQDPQIQVAAQVVLVEMV